MNAPSDEAVKQPKWPTLRVVLGPGLITGASDDDPSGIATYSQAGAQFGYTLGWTLLFTYPLMCAIQLISAQTGRVIGRGLAGNIRRYFPAWPLYPAVGLLVAANTINLGADLGAMAARRRLSHSRRRPIWHDDQPYLFFWQAAEEVEDEKQDPLAKPLIQASKQAPVQMARMQIDTLVGMGFFNIIALFIMLTTAATLNAHGVTDIQTSSQAAEALRPITGRFAFTIFALGIIGTGLLAVPVLAGCAAYAVGEALQWRVGLAQRPARARRAWTVRTLRPSRRTGWSDGLANWRLRSGRRLTDRTLSDACTYRRPTANSGRWASQPCGIGSA